MAAPAMQEGARVGASAAGLVTDESLDCWCTYVLQGILDELQKVDRLTDYTFLKEKILIPALAYSVQRQLITH